MNSADDFSIVDYYNENEGYKCGYCKSPNTNYSHGIWAHTLSVQDYQDLIDRGWRRSGSYCYKPTMHLTCCPMYTIKCSVLDFKLSKSQKKKLKRFNKFLGQGMTNPSTGDNDANESTSDSGDDMGIDCSVINEFPELKEKSKKAKANLSSAVVNSIATSLKERASVVAPEIAKEPVSAQVAGPCLAVIGGKTSDKSSVKKITRPGDGMDPNRPHCKKAKLLRKERKEKKLAQLGSSSTNLQNTKEAPAAKSLEDFLYEPLPESPAHRLEIRLVRSSPASKEFKATFKAAFDVYQRYQLVIHNDRPEKLTEKQFSRFLVNSPLKIKLVNVESVEMIQTIHTSRELYAKYQMAIHNDKPDECDMETFHNFLVSSPLKPWKPRDGPPQGYGSFHQQYWLDGQLIAVGVIDILPYCVSSVYFFYDPEFQFLVLGTYGSLREIAFCRSLHHSAPSLRYYYMGFYIHSCPKMRYKGAYSPSFLLCPEVYSWHPIEYCIPLLERSKYSRLNEDPQAKDPEQPVNVKNVSILFHNEAMTYQKFLSFNLSVNNLQEVTEYASLVGDKLSKRMLYLIMD